MGAKHKARCADCGYALVGAMGRGELARSLRLAVLEVVHPSAPSLTIQATARLCWLAEDAARVLEGQRCLPCYMARREAVRRVVGAGL